MRYVYALVTAALAVSLLGLFVLVLPEILKKAQQGQQRSDEAQCHALSPGLEHQTLGSFPHPAPPAMFSQRAQQPIWLDSFIGKKAVLLYFWSRSCASCMNELEELSTLMTRSVDLPFVLVAVQEDPLSDRVIWPFAKLPSIIAAYDEGGATAIRYGVKEFPQAFLIDSQGQIHHWIQGTRTSWNTKEVRRCLQWLSRIQERSLPF